VQKREVKPCGFIDHFFAFSEKKAKKMVGIERFELSTF